MCFGGKGMFQKKRKNIQRKSIRKKTGIVFLLSILLLVVLLSGCADKDQSGTSGTAEGEAAQGDAAHKGEGEDVQGAVSGTGEEENPGASVVFEGKDMEGNVISSDIFAQSRLTMINVWATYCNPCLREMPELAQLPDEYDAADFQLIGIISDLMEGTDGNQMEEAEALIEQTGADYPHLLLNLSVYEALLTDVTAVPTTFFLDGEGNVLDTVVGAMDKESWKEKIDAFLEE